VPADDTGEPKQVTLIDESGRERKFTLHDAFELEGDTYYLVEGADDPSEVLLLREEEGALQTVEDAEFQRVMTALEQDQVE
jgi:uncharacterized Ntn-hydrolase superfamily protein